ncbi:MAG: hypothetical protein DRP56_07810 [Planctomycetota bacterium]|nr:MAG: hypothetical protein DRP56_07810 [Planctomycetota bacterium]
MNKSTKNDINADWKKGDPIVYINDDIPDFDVPAYKGERYEAMVPDTLDLQERAAWAVNGLTGPTDPEADYELYFLAWLKRNPPMMEHSFHDQCQVKLMEALPLMRLMSGSDFNAQVDRRWMEVTLRMLGPDNQMYIPVKGRPWAFDQPGGPFDFIEDLNADFLDPVIAGRLLSSMILYHKRDGGSLWKNSAERVVDGLSDLAVDRGSYAYFSPRTLFAIKGHTEDPLRDANCMVGTQAISRIQLGLMHLCRETGYEPALDLAKKLINYSVDEIKYFGEDGTFPPDGTCGSPTAAHFHQHVYGLQCLAEYMLLTGDDCYMDLVQKGYEYGKSQGNTLLGYFPEIVRLDKFCTSELCQVADMIALALELTELGIGDYWDDADRWVRNMFTEGQLSPTQADWMARHAAQLPASTHDPMCQTTDNVLARHVGAFAGWPHPNDWGYDLHDWPAEQEILPSRTVMHCCTGNASRALYYVWERMVQYKAGKLKVNLLLNRASQWADVDSHIPYAGQVDVKIKKPVNLSIRIPEWVSPKDVRIRVDGKDIQVKFNSRYALVGDVVPGNVVTMTFPIAERTDSIWVEKHKYNIVRKGNEVVAMDPMGEFCPLYLREHYRANDTRWHKAERFVSDESIHW